MNQPEGPRRRRLVPGLLRASVLCSAWTPVSALEPPLHISQYALSAWTAKDGAALGLVFAMAQTHDG